MEISFFEGLLVALIAFLVLGPAELVRLSQKVGRWVGRFRTEMNNVKIMAQEQILKADEERRQTLKTPGKTVENNRPGEQ